MQLNHTYTHKKKSINLLHLGYYLEFFFFSFSHDFLFVVLFFGVFLLAVVLQKYVINDLQFLPHSF